MICLRLFFQQNNSSVAVYNGLPALYFYTKQISMGKTNSIHGKVSGKVGLLTFCSIPGSDEMIVRARPQMSTHARKHHRRFEKTRQENNEFKGCVKAAREILLAVHPVKHLGDFNSFGYLVRVCKFIQQADSSTKGKRSVLFSKAPSLLNGFSFNKYHPFETLVRPPLSVTIDRQNGNAEVTIPALRPSIQLENPKQQPLYRFVFSLGRISDLILNDRGNSYESLDIDCSICKSIYTRWFNCIENFPQTALNLHLQNWDDLPYLTLLAGIGIEFGREMPGGEIESVKYAGAGKIWSAS